MTKFSVNDRPVEYRMDPETPLLWALRDASNLTGSKYGCGTGDCGACTVDIDGERSEEHTSELQSLMRISYAVFCLKKKTKNIIKKRTHNLKTIPNYNCNSKHTYINKNDPI